MRRPLTLGVCLVEVLSCCSSEPSRARPAAEDAARGADAEVVRPRPDASYAGLNIDSATVGMVRIPAGPFLISCDRERDPTCDWSPLVEDKLPEYYIDKTEVTVAAYRRCVEDKRCTAPASGPRCTEEQLNWGKPGRDEHPVNCVTIEQAGQYCHYLGRHLPTERQWEKAARGTDGRSFPWGFATPSCKLAIIKADLRDSGPTGCGKNSTWPVGSRPDGASPYGALDMVGNVAELVTVWQEPNGPADPGDDEALRAAYSGTMGGSYVAPPDYLRARAALRSATRGARCSARSMSCRLPHERACSATQVLPSRTRTVLSSVTSVSAWSARFVGTE